MKKLSRKIFAAIFGIAFLTDAVIVSVIYALGVFEFSLAWLLVLIAFLAVLCILICFPASKFLTKRITKPLNDINLSSFKNTDVYEELSPFFTRLKAQSSEIRKKMNQIKREHKIQDKIRQEFTANVSHELKTPLTSISGYAEIIKDGLVKQEDITRFSEKIYNEAQRLISLVGDIIKLSRLDENAVSEQKERIELHSLCETIITRLEPAAAKRGVAFELIGAKVEISGIPRIIDEMIYNLCDNAIKYNCDNGKVTVSVMQTATKVILSVADTGIGIPEGETERVFERFYRVNKSHSKEIGGTGLGLSIVKHGAAVHNAELSVESKLNEGTTVSIAFKNY